MWLHGGVGVRGTDLLHQMLRLSVQGAGGFIQNENGGVTDEGPGRRHRLVAEARLGVTHGSRVLHMGAF